MTELIAGQNITIPSDNAYCLSLDIAKWTWGVIVTQSDGAHAFLDGREGLSMRENNLFINLFDVQQDIEKLTLYIAEQPPADSAKISCILKDLVGEQEYARIDISQQLEHQSAVNLLEIYRRNGAWKVRCVLQGYNDGLDKLLATFSLSQPALQPSTEVFSAPSQPASHPPPQQLSGDTAAANVSLRWESGKGSNRSVSRYFIGENFKAISDLRIGCFYQLNNGQNGIVYSFDDSLMGPYDGVPYIQASRDSNSHHEQLSINPLFRHKLDKYLIFVTMMEAYDSWEGLNVTVDFQLPDIQQQAISPQTLMVKPIYAVAMIDFSGEQTKLTTLNEYFDDLTDMDRAFGWGLPWRYQNDPDNEDE